MMMLILTDNFIDIRLFRVEYTDYKHCKLTLTSALRLLGRFAAEHNHIPTALRLVRGLYTSNIDYKA